MRFSIWLLGETLPVFLHVTGHSFLSFNVGFFLFPQLLNGGIFQGLGLGPFYYFICTYFFMISFSLIVSHTSYNYYAPSPNLLPEFYAYIYPTDYSVFPVEYSMEISNLVCSWSFFPNLAPPEVFLFSIILCLSVCHRVCWHPSLFSGPHLTINKTYRFYFWNICRNRSLFSPM